MDSFDHEKVFKILQSMRTEKPIISICTDFRRSFSLDAAVKAIGFRTIFPNFQSDRAFTLPQGMTTLLDFSFLIDKTPEQARSILKTYKKQDFKIFSIGEEIHFVAKNALKILKGCLKAKPDVIICDHNISDADLQKAITDAGTRLFIKSSYKPIVLRVTPEGDILSDGETSLIVYGGNDPVHNVICDPLMVGSFVAAAMEICEDSHFSAFSSALFLRASSKRALSVTNGPGSFYPVFIDSLYHLKRDYIYQVRFDAFDQKMISAKSLKQLEAA